MMGKCRAAVFFAVSVLMFFSMAGISESASNPAKSSLKSEKTNTPAQTLPRSSSDHTYVIRRGDSLIKIARTYGTTTRALQSANGLKGTRIKAGQTLIIPGLQAAAASKEEPLRKEDRRTIRNEEYAARYISQLRDQNLLTGDESSSVRVRFLEAGFKLIGIRYRFSGGSEKTGFDCSGLVKDLFSKFNIELPHSSREQFKQGEKVDRDKLEIGDLVFFSSGGSRPTHVGIYIGNDKFLHAARKARQVIVSDLNKIWYTMRYLGARRISDLWSDEEDSTPEKGKPTAALYPHP
jgi:cell wall-associated NlpC family hydrolase